MTFFVCTLGMGYARMMNCCYVDTRVSFHMNGMMSDLHADIYYCTLIRVDGSARLGPLKPTKIGSNDHQVCFAIQKVIGLRTTFLP